MRNRIAHQTVKAAKSRLAIHHGVAGYQWTRPAKWDGAPTRRVGVRKVEYYG